MSRKRSHTKLCPKHGKKIFTDWVSATLTLEEIQLRSRREIHNEVRSHPCEFGYGWHLTSEEQRTEVPGIRHSA
jgi:hypothetical protein